MKLRIHHVLYAFAVVAINLALLGWLGLLVALGVLLAWGGLFRILNRQLAWSGVFSLVVVALLPLMLLAFVGRGPTRYSMSFSRTMHLELALWNYQRDHGRFPPPYVVDDQGRPLYSWRVLLLPYLDQEDLYNAFRLDEPWDSPHNRSLVPRYEVFSSPQRPKEKNVAHYLAVVDESTIWDPDTPTSLSDVTDPPEETIALIEVWSESIHWSEPRDLSLEQAMEFLTSRHYEKLAAVDYGFRTRPFFHYARSRPYVLFVSDACYPLDGLENPELARALLTKGGGERMDELWATEPDTPRVTGDEPIRWDRVWGAGLWLVIVLLPMRWAATGTRDTPRPEPTER